MRWRRIGSLPDPVLVHDYLLVLRGAERTFLEMSDEWPDAPIATLLYDEEGTGSRFAGRRIATSRLQRLGVRQLGFRRLLPLYPAAAERLPVTGHDVVISSSSAFAHGVRPDPGAVHICYCHSPFRYAWHERGPALRGLPAPLRPALDGVLGRVRAWDRSASERVTRYVANSQLTRERIQRFYDRDATVVHPPVDTTRFTPGEPEDFLLVVGELVAHKRIDLAIEAARRAGRPMKIVGTGPELERLRVQYDGAAEFLGRVDDRALEDLYARAAALVVPNVEEFGIAAVEAQAAGRPVIAPAAGGTAETVIDGVTGVLVDPGDTDALAEAMRETDFHRFDPAAAVESAGRFAAAAFRRRLRFEVEQEIGGLAPMPQAGVAT